MDSLQDVMVLQAQHSAREIQQSTITTKSLSRNFLKSVLKTTPVFAMSTLQGDHLEKFQKRIKRRHLLGQHI